MIIKDIIDNLKFMKNAKEYKPKDDPNETEIPENPDENGLDWNQKRPDDKKIESMWNEIKFEPLSIPGELTEFITELSTRFVNGGVKLFRFKVLSNHILDWYTSRNRLDEVRFLQNFLFNKSVAKLIEEIKPKIEYELKEKTPSQTDLISLDSDLARLYHYGGAYAKWENDKIPEIKNKSRKFVAELTSERYGDFLISTSHEPWAEWFHGVAWDSTYCMYDKNKREVWLLLVTDTD